MEKELNEELRKLTPNGFIGFSIKAKNTPQNEAVHTAFRDLAIAECDGNYTLALRKLLENYEMFAHFEVLVDRIVALEQKVQQMAATPVKEKKEEAF